MESLLKLLNSYNPKLQYAQFASNGNWEDAVRLDFESINKHNIYSLIDLDDSIAGELFYRLNDGRQIFFGLRMSSALNIDSPKKFLESFIDVLENTTDYSINEVLIKLGQQLNNNPNTFINADVNYVELGVEGYWKSEGSRVLRKSNESTISKDTLEQLLNDNNNLIKNNKNHIALEFAVEKPEFWFGIQVSKKENTEYITNLDYVVELSNLI